MHFVVHSFLMRRRVIPVFLDLEMLKEILLIYLFSTNANLLTVISTTLISGEAVINRSLGYFVIQGPHPPRRPSTLGYS